MEDEILDYLKEDHKSKRFKYSYLIPFILQCTGIFFSTISGLLSEFKYLLGFSALVITGIAFLLNTKKGILVNGLVIILGVANLANFFPVEITFGTNTDQVRVGLDLINLLVAGLFLYINTDEFKPQFQNLLHGTPETQAKIASNKVNKFKTRFKNKSANELNQIANNPMLVSEAQQAAKELIEEKQKTNTQKSKYV